MLSRFSGVQIGAHVSIGKLSGQ